MDLVNGIFYRASCDGAPVAITADYPGLLPSSRVNQAKNSILRREFFPDVTPYPWYVVLLQKRRSERRAEPLGTRYPQASGLGRLKRKANRTDTPLQR